MANLKEIKLKIGSVKNTQKTTKAMKLVSSAKLTRTRQLSEQARSYARKINEVLSDIAARVSKVQDEGNIGLCRRFAFNSAHLGYGAKHRLYRLFYVHGWSISRYFLFV